MKKGFLLVPLLTSAVLLGGCGNSQVSHSTHQNNAVKTNKVADQNSQKNQSSATVATTTAASDQQEQSLWNQSKNQKLASFMQKWGTTMNQQYKSYGPGNNTNFYGIAFPQQFDQTLLKVDNQTVSMKWSNDGTGNADYNVVAIYCDSDSAQPMNEHLYLFTFHNGDPVVLITQQTNGNVTKSADNGPDDGLHFKETANQDLSNGFKAIANGKTPKLNGQKANNAGQSSNSNNQSDAPDNFPANMQGTWYTYDKDSDKMRSITISGNKLTDSEDPNDVTEVHKITDSEKQANQSNPQANYDSSKKDWAYFNHIDGWLNIYGWYQGAGDGDFLKVTNQNINGQNVPVLADAGGANITVDANYYRSKDLAMQQKDTTYPGQHTMSDDNDNNNN